MDHAEYSELFLAALAMRRTAAQAGFPAKSHLERFEVHRPDTVAALDRPFNVAPIPLI